MQNINLCHEHCSGRNLHIVAKFKVLQESYCLCHTYVPIHLKAHIGNWVSWVDIPNYILSDDVQSRCLTSE